MKRTILRPSDSTIHLQISDAAVLMATVIEDESRAKLKLLVFAHKPPPHHGQSYMVQLLLDCLETDARTGQGGAIQYFHVDARLSTSMEDVGRARWSKLLPLLKYCAQAIWRRCRHGVRAFYYVPAPPGTRSALIRDWVVMALCRPFFPVIIYHWHAAGLGEWLAHKASPWQKRITHKLLGRPSLSIVLTEHNQFDAQELSSQRTIVVPNGIPDPCPNFEKDILPTRIARAQRRRSLLGNSASHQKGEDVFHVLFISTCTASKGLFDAVQGMISLNDKLQRLPVRVQLSIAGDFADEGERKRFEELVRQHNVGAMPLMRHIGFVSGDQKRRLFAESDCLCFPTYYHAENLPVVILEAMAFGLPIVTTRWRSIPELLPAGYPGLVDTHAPDQIAEKLFALMHEDYDPRMRTRFVENYTVDKFCERMKQALLSCGNKSLHDQRQRKE